MINAVVKYDKYHKFLLWETEKLISLNSRRGLGLTPLVVTGMHANHYTAIIGNEKASNIPFTWSQN